MKLSPEEKDNLQADPAKFIERQIKKFVQTSPDSRLSFRNNYVLWDEPLVKFADGNDPIFTEYKSIIATAHYTPREALAKAYNKIPEDITDRLSVISWILPAVEETRISNRNENSVPSRLWAYTRWYGEKFNDKLRGHMVELITDSGYMAVAPALHPYFQIYSNEKGPYSNWSERHIAFAAGHGTFSLSDGFITERGIAHRCGSVVTNIVLPASNRTAASPYANCLFYLGVDCHACIDRCPTGAITNKGHDKNKCQQYLHSIGYNPEKIKDYFDNDKTVIGCGLCQTGVPCEFKNPTKNLKHK
jgi:epoxyqueuosine reductase